ncbi:formimidoylglutamate deiminase [Rubrivivax rivuli]|uniref:Formimidoylglutamate deiminase n=1 Tax=Rubrivivax rivuli TaxID=1862385 RepID=A0A437RCQ0_9BURK|nr:formimidoylglutamate deiminase [Rubrivivax rivuli]RVU44474.1 formimidoylglutamate deiminase [Rubrivivax rivuli]
MSTAATRWWAPAAWVNGAWAADVLLQADTHGHWAAVTPGTPAPSDAEHLPGRVLPALVNAHSHAFQRAFIGLAEQRDSERDDFWSWRDRMYGVALRLTPEQLFDVAQHLYTELLAGGYTHTCEFHYLHHAPDGRRYGEHGGDDLAMARALAEAAQATGMGLTLLPVLYERAGFAQPALRDDQRRFATDLHTVLRWREALRGWALPQVSAGLALHSLRAARPASLRELAVLNAGDPGPVHIHVAEQTAEVDDCLAHTGHRPIAWLLHEGLLDTRWQLVHATHATPAEIDGVAASGAGVVLCPGTEANLGDGFCDLPRWLAAGVPLSLGSDSQVTRTWPEELRWLEYGQRLVRRQRNVAAAPGRQPATAARLFETVRAGGAAAAGLGAWGLQAGARADFVVLDTADPALIGLPAARLLDATVFAAPTRPFAAVYSAGRRRTPPPTAAERFRATLQGLWPG